MHQVTMKYRYVLPDNNPDVQMDWVRDDTTKN